MKQYTELAIPSAEKLIFGTAPHPVTTRSGMVIGGGTVYPEINFTLPPMTITEDTMPEVRAQYQEMIDGVCQRAADLHVPGLVVELELLPPMTLVPEWGAQVTSLLRETMDRFADSDGLKSALRVTPNDTRETARPPIMRSGQYWESMIRSFELNAAAGADMLSIESTGGKEIHDGGIINADVSSVAFALGVLGCNDMAFLWDMITDVCNRYGVIPAGDSACGFGNTAMVLAEKKYIPQIWAAMIRVMTVPRALVAHEHGAVGPSKDCAYENPYLKAITGCPISAEGAESACAHLSPVGNVAHAAADLWSNESVQNIKLLGGMAPTVSVEQLTYGVRLMNTASASGEANALLLRDWYCASDVPLDPQAYVLSPEVVVKLASEIIAEPTGYLRTRRAALATLELLRNASQAGEFAISEKDESWLDLLSDQADELPEDEQEFTEEVTKTIDRSVVRLDQYGVE